MDFFSLDFLTLHSISLQKQKGILFKFVWTEFMKYFLWKDLAQNAILG